MGTTSNQYALILCGGSGPRLWPLSRADYPKQFLKLFDDQTLLELTINRFLKLLPAKNIYIVTNKKYQKLVIKNTLGKIPETNILLEPDKKNTCMAIIYGTSVIHKVNNNAVITATPSDHYIKNDVNFIDNINQAFILANKTRSIITIGLKPSFPNPAFGYILSNRVDNYYRVSKFVEKPIQIDAQILIHKGAFWNSGIYTFTPTTLLNEFKVIQSEYYGLFSELTSKTDIASVYMKSPSLSIDKALSEASKNLLMIEAKFEWSDVGEWQSIYSQISKSYSEIAVLGKNAIVKNYNSKRCLCASTTKKIIGLVGLNNIAIIDTTDGLLVCNLNESYFVRDLVAQIVDDRTTKNYFLKSHDKPEV